MEKRNGNRFGGIVLMAGLLVALAGCGDDDTATEARSNDAGGSGGTSGSSGAGGNAGTSGSVDAGGSAGAPGSLDAGDPSSGGGGTGGRTTRDAGDHGSAGQGDIDAGADVDAGADHGGNGGDPDAPTWSADVYPMLVGSCGGCHANSDGGAPRPGPGETGGDAPGKFAVEDSHMAYLAVKPFAIAHDPDDSVLYIKISQDEPSTGGQRMPPALRQLEDSTIQMVRDWIAAGAAEN